MCVAGYRVELTEMVCHIVVLSMTIVSLVLATVPFWSPTPPTIRQRQIFMWCDFFITFIFLMDLVVSFNHSPEKIRNNKTCSCYCCCCCCCCFGLYVTPLLLYRFALLCEIEKQIRRSRFSFGKTGQMCLRSQLTYQE